MNMENSQHKAILEALQSGANDAIRDAAFSAGDQGMQDAVPRLCEHIKSPSVGVQEAAEYALRKIRGPQVVIALLPLPDFWIAQLNYIGLYALVSLGLVLLTGVGEGKNVALLPL